MAQIGHIKKVERAWVPPRILSVVRQGGSMLFPFPYYFGKLVVLKVKFFGIFTKRDEFSITSVSSECFYVSDKAPYCNSFRCVNS